MEKEKTQGIAWVIEPFSCCFTSFIFSPTMIKNVCKLPKELGCRLYVWLQLQLQCPKSKEFLFTNQVTVAEMLEKKYFATFRGLKFTKTQILTIWKGTVWIWVTVRSFYCLLSVGSKFLRPSSSCFFLLLFLTWGAAHFWKLVFGEKMFWKQKLNLPLGCVKNEVMSTLIHWGRILFSVLFTIFCSLTE